MWLKISRFITSILTVALFQEMGSKKKTLISE